MDSERNYPIKIHSKQLNKQFNKQFRLFSTISHSGIHIKNNLGNRQDDPYSMSLFFCGLTDGEGCFTIGLSKAKKNKIG